MATKATTERYIEAVGRRKTSIARARITPAAKSIVSINNKDTKDYFDTLSLQSTAMEAFTKTALTQQFAVTIVVSGGGIAGQAVAVRHALARALIEYDINLRGLLKSEGFLKRDPRAKERRKAGFVKARKRKQWSKR